VPNPQSVTIIGTAGGATRSVTLTVTTEFQATNGAHLTGPRWDRGRTGHLPTGGDRLHLHRHWDDRHLRQRLLPGRNQVKLDARPAQGLSFLGWEFETSCRDAPKVTVAAGVAHTCRPVFRVK
jgi:hypothetical protein